jgi:hypothetical protein
VSHLSNQERAAIEAVAKNFSATWNSLDPQITVGRKRVDLQIATLKRRGTAKRYAAKPRLRFDKVATRVLNRLQVSAGDTVPRGITVALTITAPIRLASKTVASLEDTMRALFVRKRLGRDEQITIRGNRVRIRVLRNESARAPKLIGFVHNSDTDPILLLDLTRQVLELFNARVGRRTPRPAGERWLVVTSTERIPYLEAYRCIYSQLRTPTSFKKILIVFGDGKVGTLTD